MLNYLKYINEILGEPSALIIALIIIFLIMQAIGELLEFKGKIVPEFMKIRKIIARRKKDRETMQKTTAMLEEVSGLLEDVKTHYSADNIQLRNKWMENVNTKLRKNDENLSVLKKRIDETFDISLSLLIENQRNTILNFASRVTGGDENITNEEFRRVMALHEDYENMIKKYGKTNGQIDIAYRIISEDYGKRFRNHEFIEDMRGYNS